MNSAPNAWSEFECSTVRTTAKHPLTEISARGGRCNQGDADASTLAYSSLSDVDTLDVVLGQYVACYAY